jgi:hypothetical protein
LGLSGGCLENPRPERSGCLDLCQPRHLRVLAQHRVGEFLLNLALIACKSLEKGFQRSHEAGKRRAHSTSPDLASTGFTPRDAGVDEGCNAGLDHLP